MANEERREPFYLYGYPPDYVGDQWDDDYYSWQRNRKPITGLLRIEELAKKLQQEADAERESGGR